MNKDNQYDLVVGQCRHCHKTYQRLRYSYYILTMLCSVKCSVNYYAKYYYNSLRYYIINTGLFTPPFDTTNIEWRLANKQIIPNPVTLKEVTDHIKTIVPSILKVLTGQINRFKNFITPIIKNNLFLVWRGANISVMITASFIVIIVLLSLASIYTFIRSTVWTTNNTTKLTLTIIYIVSMLALQLLRILAIIPAFTFSIITLGFNSLVEPAGNYIKTINHRYPRMPFYESICLIVFAIYASHNYTIYSAYANLPEFDSMILTTNKEEPAKKAIALSEPTSEIDNKKANRDYIEIQKATLIARLKAQQAKIAEKRKTIQESKAKKEKPQIVRNDLQKNIIKKVTKTPVSKDLSKRVMVASIEKTAPIKIKKKKPSIKKIIPPVIVKREINPLYAIGDFKRGDKASINMSFTFDGGSLDNEVESILKTLKKRNIQTTFFLTGNFIKSYPNRVKQILKDGHEIANHTLSHPHLTSFEKNRKHNTLVTKEFFLSQLKKTEQNYFNVTGKKLAPFWRAPYGEVNKEIISWAFEAGYIHVGWSSNGSIHETLDTLDWVADKKSKIYFSAKGIKRKILNFESNGSKLNGGIVLMHLGTNRKSDKASSELGALLDAALYRGYRPVKASTLYLGTNYRSNSLATPQIEALLSKYLTKNHNTLLERERRTKLNSKAEAIRKAFNNKAEDSPAP